ncbi:MAG: hypothetical protein KC503_08895 [Myxococcales bacterium]|nr:hypothetical protein [Myxococcales bacterium]
MLRAIALTFVLPAVLAGCGASQRDVRALKAQIAELRALLAKSRAQQRALAADVSHLSAALQRFEPAREAKLRTLKKLGPGRFRLARSELQYVLNKMPRAMRIVPLVRNGQPSGFKLYAIRPGSIADQLGLKNGDLVVRINDSAITSPDLALKAYVRVLAAARAVITLERRRERMTITVEIKP